MTILSGDIKLMASQRMTDTEDGGGRITGKEIVSGEHNSMFPDISDLDRAYGVVNLRKVFLAVQTDDTDTLDGRPGLPSPQSMKVSQVEIAAIDPD
ncbi:hypothetical protein, partial [Aeromonas allosaccharophila]|uniref:hypothetical protein n=1 Tax=Aeromonas allosaccharophila TaxID=656 RepID=UPI003985A770